jgi:hypothetical protein
MRHYHNVPVVLAHRLFDPYVMLLNKNLQCSYAFSVRYETEVNMLWDVCLYGTFRRFIKYGGRIRNDKANCKLKILYKDECLNICLETLMERLSDLYH